MRKVVVLSGEPGGSAGQDRLDPELLEQDGRLECPAKGPGAKGIRVLVTN